MYEKKSRILYIKRFLEEQTDEEHPATVADILTYLESVGVSASRQTIARDIQLLIEAGVDVICNTGKHTEYFIGERSFELPELKMLVDAVQASRFIPPRKAAALIKKLSSLTSRHQAVGLHRSLYTDRQSRPADYKVYITVDLLHTAVNTERKITCKYVEWGADKKRLYKHGHDYSFSPYGLVWNNDRYYVVGWSDKHDKIITLRVDRIAVPKLTTSIAAPRPKGFSMSFYAEHVFQMYDGAVQDITLTCDNNMMKHIIDRFGEDVQTKIIDKMHFIAFVQVPTSPTFFAWAFTFKGAIKITSPENVVVAYREMAEAITR